MTPNGWIVAAMADGVSASPLAEIGAEIAIQSSLEYFSDFRYSPFLTAERMQDIIYDAFNYALRRVCEDRPGEEKLPFSKYTTLHLLIYGEKIGLHWGQAGDGAILLLGQNGSWKYIGERMKHEEEDGPATLQDGPDFWRFGSVDPGELKAILMMTDGLADALEEAACEADLQNEIVRLLTAPPPSDPEGSAADAYYQSLLYGESASLPTGSAASPEAIRRIRSVTDDITILLVQDPGHSDAQPKVEPRDPAEKNAASAVDVFKGIRLPRITLPAGDRLKEDLTEFLRGLLRRP